MKFYLAPMEGLTGYIYRNSHKDFFGEIDRYFTPFIASKKLSSREKNDVLPEHNEDMTVIPQILTNKSSEFISIAKQLEQRGYTTVNLNLGCPSGTVVAKHRGAGFLGLPEELEKFLSEIFRGCPIDISIKTRIGIDDVSESADIISMYNKFPLEELIIHPRLQTELYSGKPHLEEFEQGLKMSKHKICYNGDINTPEDFFRITERFPQLESVMIGRGILANPALIRQIKGGASIDIEELKAFHRSVYDGYKSIMSGDRNVLFKMKELWIYMGRLFSDSDKILKRIRKADKCSDYEAAVNILFSQTGHLE